MALTQTLDQRQLQKLSPQQIQGIKMLELPMLLLEARIKQEIEENPVLEEEKKQDEDAREDNSLEDYIRSEESSQSYKLRANNNSKDDEGYTPTISETKSLQEFLAEQLSYYNLTPKQQIIAYYIIGTLDDDGYLRRPTESITDDIAFSQSLEVTDEEVEAVIAIIQQLDPSGICARTLAECLLIQLRQLREQTRPVKIAIKILQNYYEEFVKKHYDRLMQRLGIDSDDFREAMEEIMGLNPKPANGYADESITVAPTIIPDFILDYVDGKFELSLSQRGIPDLKINKNYLKMAEKAMESGKDSDKEAVAFVRQKIESAKWFIAAIKQRQETLMKTMRAILHFQENYFIDGEEAMLRPMILKDIADTTGFDISTISRVVNSKYIQTHFGVFLLKYFFSEGLATDSGEEVSTREIKRILSECVENEDPKDPYTDEALMQILLDKGFKIARRTVAKYREMLDIPVARLRKGI